MSRCAFKKGAKRISPLGNCKLKCKHF